ncbi:MAG: hypothetical protein RL701_3956 [Pseudomonadota bacterium]
MNIRDATVADMPAITEIFNELIDSTTYTYTEQHETVAERSETFSARNARGFPTLVGVEHGQVVGFATYGDFRDSTKKPGYRFTVEHSVNIARSAWRSGLGTQLMHVLMQRAEHAGVHVMVGGIDASNQRSLVFHERLGFHEVARMPESGWKHGRWCDLVLVQKRMSDALPRPA